MVLVIIFS